MRPHIDIREQKWNILYIIMVYCYYCRYLYWANANQSISESIMINLVEIIIFMFSKRAKNSVPFTLVFLRLNEKQFLMCCRLHSRYHTWLNWKLKFKVCRKYFISTYAKYINIVFCIIVACMFNQNNAIMFIEMCINA